jgi:hypothetical protein
LILRSTWIKTVHAVGPLPGNDRALDRLQQADAKRESQWEPKQKMKPVWWRKRDLDGKGCRHHNVPGDENDEVRWRVVGAVMVQGLAANRASIYGLEEGAE